MRHATSLTLILSLSACVSVSLPAGYPPVPRGARAIDIGPVPLVEVRDAMVESGFPVERFDEDGGIIVTGPMDLEKYGTLVRATVNEVQGSVIIQGEWMPNQSQRATKNAVARTLTGASFDFGWERAAWNDNQHARAAFVALLTVARSIPGANVKAKR